MSEVVYHLDTFPFSGMGMSNAVNPVADAHAADKTCPNCEAVVSGHYCANCGQETHLHAASTREFLHEFIGHYVALEGKLWGTLKRLILRPGELTNEYIRGRRVRYVQPLRIYLTFSVIFFVLLKLTGGFEQQLEQGSDPAASHSKVTQQDKSASADTDQGRTPFKDPTTFLDEWPTMQHKMDALGRMSDADQLKLFKDGILHYAPYAIFCLMPVFALLLKILYLGSGRRFGEHMLFALHTNAFAFFVYSLILLINVGPVGFVLWVWLLGYLPWAMRRVYHRSRFGTFWRWILLMFFFTLAIALAVLVSAMIGLMSAH